MQVETSKAPKNGFAFLLVSFLLAFFLVGWASLGPMLHTGTSNFTTQDLIVFLGGCVGTVLWVWGIRQLKWAGISYSLLALVVLSLSANGLILFSTANAWLNPPEVKGTVHRIGDDYVVIDVDKDYLPEYSTAGLPDNSSTLLNAGISSRTAFYEQYGNWSWQKKAATIGNLQQGQHIQIIYSGLRFLTGDIVEAGEIVILNP
jgi:hypothetical protein